MNAILTQLGLTPEMIARHVVSVDRRPGRPDYRAKQKVLRRERRRLGLNVVTGQPLQRSPNGTRKPRQAPAQYL